MALTAVWLGKGDSPTSLTLRDGKRLSGGHFPLAGRSALSAVLCHRRIDAASRPEAQTSPGLPSPLASAPCLSAQDGFLSLWRCAPGVSSAYGRASPNVYMVGVGVSLGVLRPLARV